MQCTIWGFYFENIYARGLLLDLLCSEAFAASRRRGRLATQGWTLLWYNKNVHISPNPV
jgi:hypothetical protein